VTFEPGANEGDGEVIITWDPAEPTCPPVVTPLLADPRFTG
jgi:hypothetical protein